MSRLEQIKEEITKKTQYDSWSEYWAVLSMTNNSRKMESLLNEISVQYATEVAQASLEKAKNQLVKNADEIKPYAYRTGNWDGKQSDTIIAIDETGKYHIAVYYEGFMDGSAFEHWYDENDYLIESNITHWMEPDFGKESISNPENIVLL